MKIPKPVCQVCAARAGKEGSTPCQKEAELRGPGTGKTWKEGGFRDVTMASLRQIGIQEPS